jgi:alkylation response protein AidB-like acyl-CoA dehydrogenase
VEFARIVMDIAAADPNIAQVSGVHHCVVEELLLYGSEANKQRFFTLVRNGAFLGGAHAERSGAKIGQISTRLSRDGDAFRLNGTKYYTTGSAFADYFFVSALTGDDEKGFVIIPAKSEGLTIHDDWQGMGQRTTSSGTVTLENVLVSSDNVISLTGWRKKRTHFNSFAQLLHAAVDAGIAKGVLDDAATYARNHARPNAESGVDRAVDDPYVVQTFGGMVVQASIAATMVERAAALVDEAARASYEGTVSDDILARASIAVAEAKIASTDASLKVSEELYRLGGASSTDARFNFDRHWRNARTHTTHDPIAYKYKAIGDFYLKGALPPVGGKT